MCVGGRGVVCLFRFSFKLALYDIVVSTGVPAGAIQRRATNFLLSFTETQYVDGRESFYNILTSDEMRKSDHEKDLTYVDGEVFADALQTIATKSKTLISRSSTSRKSTLDNNQSCKE